MIISDFPAQLTSDSFSEFVRFLYDSQRITIREAYSQAEDQHVEVFKKSRYENFESFKTQHYRYLKKTLKRSKQCYPMNTNV